MASFSAPSAQSGNHLLSRLPQSDRERMMPQLQAFPLKHGQVLCKVHAPLDFVYFPTSGIISAMTVMKNGSAIEVGTQHALGRFDFRQREELRRRVDRRCAAL